MRDFIAERGVTFTMLWSESNRPTGYYHVGLGRWSGFWLLDHNGNRVVKGLYEDADQIKELLAGLE